MQVDGWTSRGVAELRSRRGLKAGEPGGALLGSKEAHLQPHRLGADAVGFLLLDQRIYTAEDKM